MNIRVYGLEMCRECARAKAFLEEHQIPFVGVDAENLYDLPVDPDVISTIVTESKGKLPIIQIGNQFFSLVGEINGSDA